MATHIVLLRFTEQGIRDYKDTLKRKEEFAALAEKHCVMLKEAYWTIGSYDGVVILESPDEEAAVAMVLALGSLGNVRSETLRAFDRSQIESILDKAP